ncbi:MAG: Uma2 family endonuclease [Ancylobacter novellus]|uniref:Uma2 family endonuclease n=1 Tax=Ancylobacter novellus TaxID=921 RepID=A0A2W5KN49_ANCNO|nr:MAG: Uma2 family endonuclease [Ancylobacter novellus]
MNYPLMRPRRLTVAEFRELEAQAPDDERWELINGVIYKSMAGGTRAHNAIVQNVTSALLVSLRRSGSPCRPYSENMRLDIEAAELSTLPDVVVTCAPVSDGAKAIDKPAAVIEVLSRSTSARDRTDKLEAYFTLASVRTIALIDQEAMLVVVHTRTEEGWLRSKLTDPSDRLEFAGVGASLALSEIYEEIAFDQTRPLIAGP